MRTKRIRFGHPHLKPNRLFHGDNLEVMRGLPGESIDLIYIDPPFFSGRQYKVGKSSFSDVWKGGMGEYLEWLNVRLCEMKRLLKKTGSIYVHLDWHVVHYVKVEMDKIFGMKRFTNEIIWKRSVPHNNPKRFGAIHDTLLYYRRTEDFTFNQQYTRLSEEYKQLHYGNADKDGRRYQLTSLVVKGLGTSRKFGRKKLVPSKGNCWRYSQEQIDTLLSQGRIVFTSTGNPRFKRYLDETRGTALQSLWGIGVINVTAKERVGYPTQKPEALLERIINVSSNENDLIADFFCGSGTTSAVAQRLGRCWIACDSSQEAVATTERRLKQQVEHQTGSLFPVPDFTIEHVMPGRIGL